jgi:ABC-type transport system involved in cytochrome bd biosynthesis fused ATPase/permease subunit
LRTASKNPPRGRTELIETIIDAKGVWKRYDAGRHKIDALKGIDLTVLRGEVVAVMGPSGLGVIHLPTLWGGRAPLAAPGWGRPDCIPVAAARSL